MKIREGVGPESAGWGGNEELTNFTPKNELHEQVEQGPC